MLPRCPSFKVCMRGEHALTKPAKECAEEGEHQWQLQPCGPVPAKNFCWTLHESCLRIPQSVPRLLISALH